MDKKSEKKIIEKIIEIDDQIENFEAPEIIYRINKRTEELTEGIRKSIDAKVKLEKMKRKRLKEDDEK